MQSEFSSISEELLNDFIPDDVCPLGAQLFMDAPKKLYQVDSTNSKAIKEVITLHRFLFSFFSPFFAARHNPISFARVWRL